MKFQLPAADYPKSCGYVSLGVIITVNKMNHGDHHEDDKYTPTDVTVSVTYKPKAISSSDSTNWANNIYAQRINFREEHELPISLGQELLFESVPENLTKTIIFVRDSLLLFEIMSIEDDFIRLKEGGDHLEREKCCDSRLLLKGSIYCYIWKMNPTVALLRTLSVWILLR